VHGDRVHDPVFSLGESCNHFFYQLAEGIELDGVLNAYRRFGLYEPGAEEEVPAFQHHIPGVASSRDAQWEPARGLHRLAIGYGVSANVLQLARTYAGLATGRLPELSLVRRDPAALRPVDMGFHDQDLDVVRQGLLYCAVQGTAAKLGLVDTWAKTGTAEVTRAGHNNAWFAGYVGSDRPRLAFASAAYLVPKGEYGADVAGPMIRAFLEKIRSDVKLREEYL
jgi:cell division protein FtsI/penicillin-binding protein 2